MKPEIRRQVMLAGLLIVAVAGYLRFGVGLDIGEASAGLSEDLPAIDVSGLMNAIKDVATIDPALIGPPPQPDSDADRNLFQYGQRRPPPPTPAELEQQRLQAEAQLKAQEEILRRQKEQERIQEEERKKREQEQQEQQQDPNQPPPPDPDRPPPPPAEPPKPPPPAINFKLMGMMGPPDRKLGVFLDGDKVMMGRKGDVLQGQFKVLSIGVESAEIGYVDPIHKDLKKKLILGQQGQ